MRVLGKSRGRSAPHNSHGTDQHTRPGSRCITSPKSDIVIADTIWRTDSLGKNSSSCCRDLRVSYLSEDKYNILRSSFFIFARRPMTD